jgi:UDP-glucose 4-epimerase
MILAIVGGESRIAQVDYARVYGDHFEETNRRMPDVRRAEAVLGFRADTSLEEGLRKTVAWFEQAWPIDRLLPAIQTWNDYRYLT